MKQNQLMAVIFIGGILLGAIGGLTTVNLVSPIFSGPADIRYGGQYYPGEFLLYGYGGIWNEYGLKIKHTLFSSGGDGNDALIANQVDINVGSDSKTAGLFTSIEDEALIIGTVQRGDRYSTVVKTGSGYTSWDDLVGKNIGIKSGTGAEAVMKKYFASNMTAHTWNEFNWLNMEVTTMIGALESGQIDAFTAWELTPTVAVDQGVGEIMMSYGDVAMVPVSIHTTKSFAYSHPAEVVAFLAAHLEKYDMIKNNVEKAAEYAVKAANRKGIDVSKQAFIDLFSRIDFSIDFNQTVIDEIEDTAQFLYDQGKIEFIPTFSYDRTFLEAAMMIYEAKQMG